MPQLSAAPGAVRQTKYSADTTQRSTSSTSFAASGSSVTITGVKPGSTLRVRAIMACGGAGANMLYGQIRRGSTDLTPGGKTSLGGSGILNNSVQLASHVLAVDDAGHGGGDVTYNLYIAAAAAAAVYLGISDGGTKTAPSVIWIVEEITR